MKFDFERSVTYADGRTFTIGQRVVVVCAGEDGGPVAGEVIGFGMNRGAVTVKVNPDNILELRRGAEWNPLKDGSEFVRIRDHGAFGGELEYEPVDHITLAEKALGVQ